MAIDYGKGEKKTNENITKLNKAGKSFMGTHATPVIPVKKDTPPPKPAPKKKK